MCIRDSRGHAQYIGGGLHVARPSIARLTMARVEAQHDQPGAGVGGSKMTVEDLLQAQRRDGNLGALLQLQRQLPPPMYWAWPR